MEYKWRFSVTDSEQVAHAFKSNATYDFQSLCGRVNMMNGPWGIAKNQQQCLACRLAEAIGKDKDAK